MMTDYGRRGCWWRTWGRGRWLGFGSGEDGVVVDGGVGVVVEVVEVMVVVGVGK